MGVSDERLAGVWSLPAPPASSRCARCANLGVSPSSSWWTPAPPSSKAITPYLYSSYDEEDEAPPTAKRKVIILGSGPNRIGQGIEFDYCCCHAAFALREDGYETIMVNCNPETVSTDYDTSDRLYFEPLTLEDVLAVYEHEASGGAEVGMIVQFGGQTPLNLALPLKAAGVPILGTSPESIDLAEDRKRFGKLLEELQIPQPPGVIATSVEEALAGAERIGYPVLVRPSYVLGGRAMVIAYDARMRLALHERGRRVFAGAPRPRRPLPRRRRRSRRRRALRRHRRCHRRHHAAHRRGRHPLRRLLLRAARRRSRPRDARHHPRLHPQLALALNVIGLVNLQFAIQRAGQPDKVFVIEVNPRASRTVPYVSKATGVPLAKIASRLMTGRRLSEFLDVTDGHDLGTGTHFFVKSPVFPWSKFPGVDTVLGPEMKSTGEVMGVADNFGEAFAKAQLSAGLRCPLKGTVFFSVSDRDKTNLVNLARQYVELGFHLVATEGTANAIEKAGMQVERVYKVKEGRPNVVDLIKGDRIQLIVNTPRGQDPFFDEKAIRRAAVLARVPTITTLAAARAAAEGIAALQRRKITVNPLQKLHAEHVVAR